MTWGATACPPTATHNNPRFAPPIILVLLFMLGFGAPRAAAGPGGTSAFTYQGRLINSGALVDEQVDMVFRLFDLDVGGTEIAQFGDELAPVVVDVEAGIFTTQIDFGFTPFNGQALWLEIAVRFTATGGAYETLMPRQPLTATPYAFYALAGGTPRTLDEAYDAGGPGAGRTIIADAGPVAVDGPDGMTINGPVGIGLTPNEALDVLGNIQTDDTVYTNMVSSLAAGGSLELKIADTPHVVIDESTGNVGVGAPPPGPPAEALDVAGNAQVSDTVYTNMVSSLPTGGSLELKINDTPHVVIDEATGNVGIGSPPPAPPIDALHVAGCVRADCFVLDATTDIEISPLGLVRAADAQVELRPQLDGTVNVRPLAFGAQRVLLPLPVPTELLGTRQRLANVRICYRVASATSFITQTHVGFTNDDGTAADAINDGTDLTSQTWTCVDFSVNPTVQIDGPLFAALTIQFAGVQSAHEVEIGRVTVTLSP